MKKCLVAGSFDPFTIGHLNLVKQASQDFDFVYIMLGNYILKRLQGRKRMYTKKSMIAGINFVLKQNNITNAKCVDLSPRYFCGALRAKKLGCCVLARGIRNKKDIELEEKIAKFNQAFGCPTIFYIDDDKYSSTKYKQALKNNGNASDFLPAGLKQFLVKTKDGEKCL